MVSIFSLKSSSIQYDVHLVTDDPIGAKQTIKQRMIQGGATYVLSNCVDALRK